MGPEVIVIAVLVLSRLLYLASYPHFYDSVEYLREAASADYWASLGRSHESVHPVYLWLVQLTHRLQLPPSLASALAGIIGVLVFYVLVKEMFGRRSAHLSILPLVLFPHLWLLHTHIMHEAVDHAFFLTGLLFFCLFLKTNRVAPLLAAVLNLSLALFNFTGMLVWFPAVFGVAILSPGNQPLNKRLGWAALAVMAAMLLAGSLLLGFLARIHPDPVSRLQTLVLGYGAGRLFGSWSALDILRTARNALLIMFNGYSPLALVVAGATLYRLAKAKRTARLLFFLSFLIPFFLTAKFWYGGLMGRYGSLVAYPVALMFALVPSRKAYAFLTAGLILFLLPTLRSYIGTPVPRIQAELITKVRQPGSVLVISDYQRPQLEFEGVTDGKTLIVTDSDLLNHRVKQKIERSLQNGEKVYLTEQAVNFPYYQYDGQQLHILSKGDKTRAKLYPYLSDKQLKLVGKDDGLSGLPVYAILK